MSDFTYEFENRNERLETYEWDNVWIDRANVENLNRVFYIGDSISCATRRVATAKAEGKLYFDGFGTSKALDNPYFQDSLRIFAKQQGTRKAVVFNNGLHGWHLDDETEYAKTYEEMINFLLKEFPGTPLALIATTHVASEDREERVIKRNQVMMLLAKKYDLPVIDFYAVTKEHADLLSADGVHLSKDGYALLAEELLKRVSEIIA